MKDRPPGNGPEAKRCETYQIGNEIEAKIEARNGFLPMPETHFVRRFIKKLLILLTMKNDSSDSVATRKTTRFLGMRKRPVDTSES